MESLYTFNTARVWNVRVQVEDTAGNVDPAGGDFRVWPTSTLLDAVPDLGIDHNGTAPGRFDGSSPDAGYWESPW